MIRDANEAIDFIVNVLNPVWKNPVEFASGTQSSDALAVIRCFGNSSFPDNFENGYEESLDSSYPLRIQNTEYET